MRWFSDRIELHGEQISLVTLNKSHFADLLFLSKEKRIWQYFAVDGSNTNKLKSSLEKALTDKKLAIQYPFVIIFRKQNKIIGSTRFLDVQQEHKKLEIGWTWLHPDYWGTAINLECKLLLLTYCFDILPATRVQLKTDEVNIRSRKAIEKIGGHFEGILRNDMIRDNGTKRNSAYYSITDDDWINVKDNLELLIKKQSG
jgi:RimJ/RimL family protein N-acetyltransferase